jgi:predicted AlkP superfamily phosphohydrolase/phosphomutase
MSLFRRLQKHRSPRVVVIGLDGTPYTFMQHLLREGLAPNFARLLEEGDFARIHSVYPTVSSVAWSTYMTGVNPARHGVFGFVDRKVGTYEMTIPTARSLRAPTLWDIVGQAGKRLIVMNVPVTYPPHPINGLLVGCFLSPSLSKATYPPELLGRLERLGYRLDADPWKARRSKEAALQEVTDVLERRVRAMFDFLDNDPWDFFQCHIMETDRLHHFLWQEMEEGHAAYAPPFFAFYRRVDEMLGQLRSRLDDNTTLVVLSDHGFCTLKKEVYINTWLQERGWLHLEGAEPKLVDITADSVAYSLDPGRVFLNVAGREPRGCVQPGAPYEALREQIAAAALELRDPDDGTPIVAQVLRREEIYHGPLIEQAADLILVPTVGYDLKGALGKDTLTFKGTELVGTHTYDDAMLYIQGQRIVPGSWGIVDVMPTVLQLMDVPIPEGLDGQVCL